MRYIVIAFCLSLVIFSCSSEKAPEGQVEQSAIEEEKQDSLAIEVDKPRFDPSQYTIKDGFVQLTWADLAKVDFEDQFVEEFKSQVPIPIFSDSIKALAGKSVEISGYVIPFEETGNETYIILSAFPFSECFFCGNAGPETVMDILVKDESTSKRLKMDQQTTFRGKLKLNDSDFYYLNYILEEAELVVN